eukprot:365646-Chlamydomonas_euryale.AAC.3
MSLRSWSCWMQSCRACVLERAWKRWEPLPPAERQASYLSVRCTHADGSAFGESVEEARETWPKEYERSRTCWLTADSGCLHTEGWLRCGKVAPSPNAETGHQPFCTTCVCCKRSFCTTDRQLGAVFQGGSWTSPTMPIHGMSSVKCRWRVVMRESMRRDAG